MHGMPRCLRRQASPWPVATTSRNFAVSDVTLHSIRSHPDREVREAHHDQSHENLFREGGNIPPIVSKSKGRNLRVIGLS